MSLIPCLFNIELSEEMYKDGYKSITNMDISKIVLEKMREFYTHAKVSHPITFEYLAMDATRMNFRDNSFDVSIDKGTYDALAVRLF
jgi:ubiquinone/menaquinone biosynthesis C-methylase UbiE